jgi:ABC-2 type transport system permease protein
MFGKLFVVQLKREYWEHRSLFVFLPLVCVLLVAGFWVLAVISDPVVNQASGSGIKLADPHFQEFLKLDETGSGYKINFANNEVVGFILALQQFMGWWFFSVVSVFLTLYYSTSCLFSDRKSRDILFWRSMPVSEHFNVFIKLVVAAVSVPLLTLLMNALTNLVLLLVVCAWLGDFGQFVTALHALPLLGNYLLGSMGLVPLILPIFAWAMLASAYAKKSPFLGATFIPLILLVADRFLNKFMGINIHIYELLKTYLNTIGDVMQMSFGEADTGYVSFTFNYSADVAIYSVIVAVLLGVVIWLRNNRYEI